MNSTGSRVAVVTGAGSGIGRAIVHALARDGARVVAADINEAAAKETAIGMAAEGRDVIAHVVDIADPGAVAALRSYVEDEIGPTTVLVNCAGWDRIEPFLKNNSDFWDRVIRINYLGVVLMSHAFASAMVERGGGGRIVNLASDAGRVGSTGEAVYAGAKGGVIAFSKSLARELAPYGINVNCVSPGPTDTPLFHQQPEKMRDALIRAIPLKRLARPEEIADAVAFLASDRASYITGQVLSVSGGLTMVG